MNGDALGEAIGRARRAIERIGLTRAVCLWLAWIGGVLSRPRVLAALVGFIAAGVWMNGGLAEIHWPQWAQVKIPQWAQSTTQPPPTGKKFQLHKTESEPAPFYRPEDVREINRLIGNQH